MCIRDRYFALHHIVTDSYEKRHKKGVLITIGDESCQRVLTREQIKKYIGDSIEDDVLASDILEQLKEKWNVFHIHHEHNANYSNTYKFKNTNWEQLLGINAVCAYDKNAKDVGDIIASLVSDCFNSAA